MKKKIDDLGRIVIPAEVRKSLNIQLGQQLNIEVEDNKIIITKDCSTCIFCGAPARYELNGKGICKNCWIDFQKIKD